jgi:hypothetical protein
MNVKVTPVAYGVFLIATGVVLAVYGRTEISIICPFGGETPGVANYCLTHQNYYFALLLTGLCSVIVGIGLVAVTALSKGRKKVDVTSRQEETSKRTIG